LPRLHLPFSVMRHWLIYAAVWLVSTPSFAQRWQAQNANTQANLRGVSAVSRKVAWASGSGGTWLRTLDAGQTWTVSVVPGAEELDFRDVVAFDEKTAILMSAGPGNKSRVYKTEDGGTTWQMLFQNPDFTGFWDCMAFWDRQHGVMLGDPVNGAFQIYVTDDGAAHWSSYSAPALAGEAAFAASGTCIRVGGDYRRVERPGEWFIRADAWFATGGAAARVFHSSDAGATWTPAAVPLAQGAPSAGIFSVAFRSRDNGIAVGGDYQKPEAADKNIAITDDGGAGWSGIRGSGPRGYRSAVAFVPATDWVVAVGTSGSDYSRDNGNTWQPVDNENYNAVSFSREGYGWAVGPKGKIARWERLKQ
jgi:photosystem II stability/assembly factor-like uncharacterized protein